MLAAQKLRHIQHTVTRERNAFGDLPINNLTEMDKSKILRYVLENNKIYWSDFTTTWNACCAMFCRVDTVKKLFINDILIDNCHSVGAIKRDFDNPFDHEMIGIILRKYIHKEKSPVTHVIGAYRHRDPYMCFTGCVAMNLFVLLNTDHNINFYDSNENITNNVRTEKDRIKSENYVEPYWSTLGLIRTWKSDHAPRDSYSQVLKANQIKWQKVTHLRKSGIEAASAAGLDAQSIGTMSKHLSERGSSKMNTAYVTELLPTVLLWASGYDKNDIHSYNNPRTRVVMPSNEIENQIFPRLRELRKQQQVKMAITESVLAIFLTWYYLF